VGPVSLPYLMYGLLRPHPAVLSGVPLTSPGPVRSVYAGKTPSVRVYAGGMTIGFELSSSDPLSFSPDVVVPHRIMVYCSMPFSFTPSSSALDSLALCSPARWGATLMGGGS
jgi:hypothetical protein